MKSFADRYIQDVKLNVLCSIKCRLFLISGGVGGRCNHMFALL